MANVARRLVVAVVGIAAAAAAPAADVVSYYHLDGIGNVRSMTDQAGQVIERHDYLPFGEECLAGPCAGNPGAGLGQTRKFTGKERDQETGLDYFGARYYSGRTGRFTTIDPVYTWTENLIDPQRWNRYAYVRNNPPRYVDPDGRLQKDANGKVVFKPKGRTRTVTHPSGASSTVQPGYVRTDNGKKVEAFQNVGSDTRFRTDCHGLTFGGGDVWINNDQVSKILKGDKYKQTQTPHVGDAGVYRDANGVVHSVTVSAVDESGTVTEVSGLGGVEPSAHSDAPAQAWQDPAARPTYYGREGDRRTAEERQRDVDRVKNFRKDQ